LEDSVNLPEPSVLALEIAEELEAALEQFATIAGRPKQITQKSLEKTNHGVGFA
jgi:hypothetical protein